MIKVKQSYLSEAANHSLLLMSVITVALATNEKLGKPSYLDLSASQVDHESLDGLPVGVPESTINSEQLAGELMIEESSHSLGQIHSTSNEIPAAEFNWKWNNPAQTQSLTTPVEEIVLPYEGFQYKPAKKRRNTYVIDNKHFVEDLTARCSVSTAPRNAMDYEPTFMISNAAGDIRLKATSSADQIKSAGFDPSKNTIIVVHGFTQSYPFTPYLRQIRNLFEENKLVGKQNFIIMDWGVISWSSYQKTAAATSVQGSFLANFIMKLTDELGADRNSIHLIGNSLGAHISSLAGKRLRPPIGRITAIDPAGPCFGRLGTGSDDYKHRLSTGDASQVIVYHYDDKIFGLPGQHGNIDIYVNGGADQPGCNINIPVLILTLKSMINKDGWSVETSHARGNDLISTALPEWCQQVAYECASYGSFKRGECGQCDQDNSQCYLMSLYFQYERHDHTILHQKVPNGGKRFYISTGSISPYCSNHYQILVKLGSNYVGRNRIKSATLELMSENDQLIRVNIDNRKSANELSHLLLSEEAPTKFTSARLLLSQQKKKKLDKPQIGEAVIVEVNFMSNIDPKKRKLFSSRFCAKLGTEAEDGLLELKDCERLHSGLF